MADQRARFRLTRIIRGDHERNGDDVLFPLDYFDTCKLADGYPALTDLKVGERTKVHHIYSTYEVERVQ